jgi:hypothetical protein
MAGGTRLVAGCFMLFGAPFLLAGLFMIGASVRSALGGEPLTEWAVLMLGGVAFAAAGIGIVLLATYGKRKLGEVERQRAEYPDEPWLWDQGWASGTVRSEERATVVFTWIVAVIWNAISAPIFFVLPDELDQGNHLALVGLLFPLVGVGFIVWAVRATSRWRKFGTSELELVTNPAPIGGVLAGTIRTRFDTPPESMKLTLTCTRRVAGRGDDSATETLLWHEASVVPGIAMEREAKGIVVPFSFEIPDDVPPTDQMSPPDTIHWRVRAEAEVTGVDYSSRFEVPVFRTDASLAEASRSHAVSHAVRRGREPAVSFDPRDATVQIAPGPGGGTEFRFGAARAPGAAVGVTAVTAVFLGSAYGIRLLGAPLLFVIVFGFFGMVLLAIAVDLWLTVTVIEIGNGDVRIRNSVLGIGRTKHIDASTVEDVDLRVGMSQNESAAQSARAWYDVVLKLSDGKTVSGGRQIGNRQEADWVVARLKEALGR